MHDLPGGSGIGLRPGARLGPFVLGERLGRGGMGLVFRALAGDGTQVALKVLLKGEGGSRRFDREAKALRSLDHEGIVRYVDAAGGPPAWLAMELVEGEDFAATVKRGMNPEQARRAVAQAAEAIAHAHERGIIHRDLKPANLLVRRSDGRVLVTDFGLTRSIDGSRFTKTGTLVGTLVYMSPEQVYGQRRIGPAADVWALGVILYEALCRSLPFDEGESMATAAAIADRTYPPLDTVDPTLPADLVATCRACLQKNPGRRPGAAELARALRARRGIGVRASVPRWLVPLAVVTALATAAAAGLALKREPTKPADIGASASGDPALGDAPTESPKVPGVADPEPSTARAPWPVAHRPWRRTWALGVGEAQLQAPALWADPGRVADPLDAARRGVSAAFLGGIAEAAADGRVRVRYTDLGRALRVSLRSPAAFFTVGTGDANRVVSDGAQARLLSPNDGSRTRVHVGDSRWGEPSVGFRFQQVEAIDSDGFGLSVGSKPEIAGLSLNGRAKRFLAFVGKSREKVTYAFPSRWTQIRFDPGGSGIDVDGVGDPTLSSALGARPSPGPLVLNFGEVHVAIADLVVAGRVLRPDVAAWGVAPGALPTSARVAAAFRVETEGWGGPLVGLVDGDGRAALSLELDRDALVLRRGAEVLARAELSSPTREGWLQLERRHDLVRGVLVGSGPQVSLEVTDPLPLPPRLRAAYGSSAPRVSFSAVEAFAGDDDPARAAFDAAFGAGGAEEALTVAKQSPDGRWRHAALLLARVSVPEFADTRMRGRAGQAERRRAASLAAERLVEVATQSVERRSDALARAVLAQIVAADSEGADSAVRDLVGLAGLDAARAAIDGIERDEGEPVLVGRILKGYVSVVDPASRAASLNAALVLAPDARGDTLVELAGMISKRGTPEDLQRALSLFEQARKAGLDSPRLNAWEGETLFSLKRYGEALPRFESGTRLNRGRNYWSWFRSALCLDGLGRPRAGLEYTLGALALEPGSEMVRGVVFQLCKKLSAGPLDGLTAAALHALARLVGGKLRPPPPRAIQPSRDPRDQDLAAYVKAQLGAYEPPQGDRPTATLVRARGGDSAARSALRDAAAQDPLVKHLALLDPDLRALIR